MQQPDGPDLQDLGNPHIALVMSSAIGDSLLTMIVANNLRTHGFKVTAFGQHCFALREWFPHIEVAPGLDGTDPAVSLLRFDTVIQLHRDRPFVNLTRQHRNAVILDYLCDSSSRDSLASRLMQFCRDEFGIANASKSSGIKPPPELVHRLHAKRVAIHPTASTADKCWLQRRFVKLALKLKREGFDPQFVVAPEEREKWRDLERLGIAVPDLGSLDNVAAWIYESGWFIGNDSGLGHLASSLEVPTLSLFMRQSLARTWRPDWGIGKVLIGSAGLPSGRLKERFWKHALTVTRVARAFAKLRHDAALKDAALK